MGSGIMKPAVIRLAVCASTAMPRNEAISVTVLMSEYGHECEVDGYLTSPFSMES